jgi:hypothetical protein
MTQAVLEFARELAAEFPPERLSDTVAWPKGVAVLDVVATRDERTLAVLIGGDDPEMPPDGVQVQPIFRTVGHGVPVFCEFQPIP